MDFKNLYSEDYFLKWSDVELENSENISIYYSVPIENKEFLHNSSIHNVVNDEIRQTVVRYITKKMKLSDDFLLIDLRGVKTHQYKNDKYSILDGYKNLITNSRINTELGDSSLFHFDTLDSYKNNNGTSYHLVVSYRTGKFKGIEVYCDPYLRYGDEEIVLFDDLEFNITDYKVIENVDNFGHIPQKNKVEFKLSWSNPNYRMVYFIDDDFNKSLSIVKSTIRDRKIDELLDDN